MPRRKLIPPQTMGNDLKKRDENEAVDHLFLICFRKGSMIYMFHYNVWCMTLIIYWGHSHRNIYLMVNEKKWQPGAAGILLHYIFYTNWIKLQGKHRYVPLKEEILLTSNVAWSLSRLYLVQKPNILQFSSMTPEVPGNLGIYLCQLLQTFLSVYAWHPKKTHKKNTKRRTYIKRAQVIGANSFGYLLLYLTINRNRT